MVFDLIKIAPEPEPFRICARKQFVLIKQINLEGIGMLQSVNVDWTQEQNNNNNNRNGEGDGGVVNERIP
jgi:hypothetical protein